MPARVPTATLPDTWSVTEGLPLTVLATEPVNDISKYLALK